MSLKTYLLLVTGMLVVALGCGVYVWYMLQTIGSEPLQPTVVSQDEYVNDGEAPSSADEQTEAITIQKEELPENQQKALEVAGIEGDSITVTPQMISCAESALGKREFEEILGGRAPGPFESIQLLGCFKE